MCFKIRSLTKDAYMIKLMKANLRKWTAELFGGLKIFLRSKCIKTFSFEYSNNKLNLKLKGERTKPRAKLSSAYKTVKHNPNEISTEWGKLIMAPVFWFMIFYNYVFALDGSSLSVRQTKGETSIYHIRVLELRLSLLLEMVLWKRQWYLLFQGI